MSRAIAAVLRYAAFAPTPPEPEYLFSWLSSDDAYDFALVLRGNHCFSALSGLKNDERRMFLLFCSLMAEDEE